MSYRKAALILGLFFGAAGALAAVAFFERVERALLTEFGA